MLYYYCNIVDWVWSNGIKYWSGIVIVEVGGWTVERARVTCDEVIGSFVPFDNLRALLFVVVVCSVDFFTRCLVILNTKRPKSATIE